MTLYDLQPGQKGIVLQVRGSNFLRKRLMEMGFMQGKEVKVVKKAPLQDPIEYEILGYHVLLRAEEAKKVDVILLSDAQSYNFSIRDGNFKEVTLDHDTVSIERKHKNVICISLIGNPNCGKSTIFNYITGSRQSTANYPGATVDARTSRIRYKGYTLEIVDLPGTYSLSSYTAEERFVIQFLTENRADVILNVIDASNLQRNLYLTTQLLDVGLPMVIALNIYDELLQKGDRFEYDTFSQLIGVPIIPTVGRKGQGLEEVLDRIIDVYQQTDKYYRHIHINYGEVIENSIEHLENIIQTTAIFSSHLHDRFYALRLLEKDPDLFSALQNNEHASTLVQAALKQILTIENFYSDTTEKIFSDIRYSFIDGALKETYTSTEKKVSKYQRISETLDNVLTHRYLGFPIFALLLWLMFFTTFSLGGIVAGWIDAGVQLIADALFEVMPEGVLTDLLAEGIIGGVGGVIVFLPNIVLLFLFISFFEGTGYLARVAFLMDHLMHKIGLHGKSFIPLIMGFGCNVPAIMASRTLENRSDKILTILIIPLMSCSARLPVYILLISAFFPESPALMLILIYFIGIFFAGVFSTIFRRLFFRKEESPFVMELPSYRIPALRTVLSYTWFRASQYLKKMGTVILFASMVVWFLGYFPRHSASVDYEHLFAQVTHYYDSLIQHTTSADSISILKKQKLEELTLLVNQREAELHSKTYIGQLGRLIEPMMRPLHFDWRLSIALLTGFPAKEIIVSTLGVLFQQYELDPENPDPYNPKQKIASLDQRLKQAFLFDRPDEPLFNKVNAFAFLLFVLFYFPCTASVIAIHKESKKTFYTVFSVLYTTLFAWVIAFMVTIIGNLIT